MNTEIKPVGVAAPPATYALAVLSPAASKLVHTAGIVPTDPQGNVALDLIDQAHEVWRTIAALLADANMTTTDIVSYTTYVVDGGDLSVVMAARDKALDGHRAASTLVVVPRLARPEWLVEIAVIAASTRA